jgi:hypothetical protein
MAMKSVLGVAMCVFVIVVAGCQPTLSKKDRQRMDQYSKPYERDTNYQEALVKAGNMVNRGINSVKVVQTKPVVNRTGSAGVPPDITEIVISSVNNLAGDLFRVVPYDPDYIKAEVETGGGMQRYLPTVVIDGAITEFDENISLKERGLNIQVYAPIKIEDKTATVYVPDKDGQYTKVEVNTASKTIDSDLGLTFDQTESISRITVDFHLLDYNTLSYLPRMHVTNTILVCSMEKGRKMGFIIYGSGINLWGKIMERQGTHQAVRYLVDYSLLHLFSLYYHLPYWRALGFDSHPKAQELLDGWRQEFLKLGMDKQGKDLRILRLQDWLMKYELGPVYEGSTLFHQIPESEYGMWGRVTQAFALKFLYQYAPQSRLVAYLESGWLAPQPDQLADLYLTLIQHIPMSK